MPDTRVDPPLAVLTLSRRQWLAVSLLGGFAALGDEPGRDATDATGVAEILARAEKAGLKEFRSSENDHYLGIGDAPAEFREAAIGICDKLATAYARHFRDKGFPAAFPDRKLVVVILKDRASYKAFARDAVGEEVGGHYDLDGNELVMFDFRADGAGRAAPSERLNTFTLVHEAIHQLTFNTGLLNRRGDVPLAIGEGLATYGELWRAGAKSKFDQVNRPRLSVIAEARGADVSWIAPDRLLTDDDLFGEESTQQLAYAQAWLLVHFLTRVPKLPKFRAYLRAIRDRSGPKHRLDDATAHLGDLKTLDKQLRRHATQIG